ncbi:MAG: gliding motility-associated C-terminal domain-containing protein [Taibaiella sp.]|nr:gliding motility-associated C-terminal domain-containing protein [Taibaiella sp.]
MKRTLPVVFRSLALSILLVMGSIASFASHVVGGDIFYTHITGLQYRITVVLYGDCGPASSGAFATLDDGPPTPAAPQICIYDNTVLEPGMPFRLNFQPPGVEITPVCPASLALTQCTNPSFAIPGIKKFTYSAIYTLPHTSTNWKFVFNSNYGPSSAGRAAAITNIVTPGSTLMELTATLDNSVYDNSSPNLTVVPTPFFCLNTPTCYTPGAIDAEGDSLRFDLIPAINTTVASGSCGLGTPVTYTGTAWGATPVSATTPLRVAAGSYNFDPASGQICFSPNFLQRSIVVYRVSEYRGGVLVGTCQREMTFLVQDCPIQPPSPGVVVDTGVLQPDGVNTYHVCGNTGRFLLMANPTPDNPTLHLTVTASGVPAGITFTVLGNGTAAPTVLFSGDASLMAPGSYTFFMNMRDDACPLNGISNVAYTINIYPVPAINASTTIPIQCIQKAQITATPGGQGSPWKIIVQDLAGVLPPDTITSGTTVPVVDWRGPGIWIYKIVTDITTQCALADTDTVVAPLRLVPVISPVNPTFCGAADGQLVISGLNAGGIDTITYDKVGAGPQPPIIGIVSATGIMIIPGLRDGTYNNIVVKYGYCTSLSQGPFNLVNPPFTLTGTSHQDATKCGYCDGWIKLHGLHPDQLDTVTFSKDGIVQPSMAFYVPGDSVIKLTGLCKANYAPFTVRTAGNCVATISTVVPITHPEIKVAFDTVIKYGCKGDTLNVINLSTPLTDLDYKWEFGDGHSTSGPSPVHVYTNHVGATYTIKLTGTNSKCIRDTALDLTLDHYITAGFVQSPAEITCQIDSVRFVNATNSKPTADYTWKFGDGDMGTLTDIAHLYSRVGNVKTTLIAHHNVFGADCYDSVYKYITVDSNTDVNLIVSGDVNAVCKGQAITILADYSTIGELGNSWDVNDGFKMVNTNPLMHAFEDPMDASITFDVKFRACPERIKTKTFKVFDAPGIYLGPDTAICEGSSPITLVDNRNAKTAGATWSWNTDEMNKSNRMVVKKPGAYAATVTIDGCSATDTVYIRKDCYVDVPNVFTPNGDGINDYFFPRELLTKSVVKFDMAVYNRWGQQVYRTDKISGQGWDGTLNGQPQPSGVYIYSIDVTFKDGMIEQHKGNITLLK